jgi:hypothetical protein
MTVTTFVSRCHFDAHLFSEPMAVMNLLWEYGHTSSSNKQNWCKSYGIFLPRLKRLDGTCANLQRRVAAFLDLPEELLYVSTPPSQMPHAMITILRIIQAWVFRETMIQFDPTTVSQAQSPKDSVRLDLGQKSDRIEKIHVEQVLKDPLRHAFSLIGQSSLQQNGSFEISLENERGLNRAEFLLSLEERLLSYSTERGFHLAAVDFEDCFAIYVREDIKANLFHSIPVLMVEETFVKHSCLKVKPQPSGKALRGRAERPCGLWTVSSLPMNSFNSPIFKDESEVIWFKILFEKTKKSKVALTGYMKYASMYFETNMLRRISFRFSCRSIIDTGKTKTVSFNLDVEGLQNGVSDLDLKDLLATSSIRCTRKEKNPPQKLILPMVPIDIPNIDSSASGTDRSEAADTARIEADTRSITYSHGSWNRPPVRCIPEAARLLSVLASSRRREHFVRFLSFSDEENDPTGTHGNDTLDVYLDSNQTDISLRWKRFGTSLQVFIETNSVPGSAVPMRDTNVLYCTCANTLELQGGKLKAEGLTLLPQGKLFLQLCRFTFGTYKQENVDDGSYITKTIALVDPDCSEETRKLLAKKVKKAVEFNESSLGLGEKLECFPHQVCELLKIFNGVDGYDESVPWENLYSNPFVAENLKSMRDLRRQQLALSH